MLGDFYLWIKALHIMAIIAWMAGLFYLPRLFVYHVERVEGLAMTAVFETMEEKLLRVIMNPAMIVAWGTGVAMVSIPGLIEWTAIWPYTKGAALIGMTWFHMWCARRRRVFTEGGNALSGRTYRMMNEVPTLFMVIIVISVIVKF